jgi:hypothetical protein
MILRRAEAVSELNRRVDFNSPMAQTAFNGTTSILTDARVPRKFLTMLAKWWAV